MYSFRDKVLVPYNRKLRLVPIHFPTTVPSFPSIDTTYIRLCLGKGLADVGATLPGAEVGLGDDGALLDDLLGLGEDELDVARVGHVGVDLHN